MIILASWTLFWTIWLIMAFGVKRNRHEQPASERRRYTLPLLLGLLLMSNLIRYVPPLAFLAWRLEGPGLARSAGQGLIGRYGQLKKPARRKTAGFFAARCGAGAKAPRGLGGGRYLGRLCS